MQILLNKAFRLDYEATKADEISIPEEETNDFTMYLHQLMREALQVKRSRKYRFPDYDTGIKTIIEQALNNQIVEACESAAQRLHEIEKEAQKRIEHLDQEIQKGILVIAVAEENGEPVFFIIKSEHFEFIDEERKEKRKVCH